MWPFHLIQLFYKVFVSSAVKQEEAVKEQEDSKIQAIKDELNDNPNADGGKNIKWSEFKVEHLGFNIGTPDDTNRTKKPKNKIKLIPNKTIIKGDSKSISIAAASIIAKEKRDIIMQE